MRAVAFALVLVLTTSTTSLMGLARETPVLDAAQNGSLSGPSEWSHVQGLMPGARLTVRLDAGEPRTELYFLEATDSIFAVLNVANVAMPKRVQRTLLATAKEHRDQYRRALKGEEVLLSDRIRLNGSGLFDRGTKLADFDHVIQRFRRQDIESIGVTEPSSSAKATVWGGVWGGLGGLGLGILLGYEGLECGSACGAVSALLVIGPSAAGALAGYYSSRHDATIIVYQRQHS